MSVYNKSVTGKLQARNLNTKGGHTSQKSCKNFKDDIDTMSMSIVIKESFVFLTDVNRKMVWFSCQPL